MKRSNVSIRFYLKSRTKDDAYSHIYVRLTVDKCRKSFSINRVLLNEDWDMKKQRVKPKRKDTDQINNQLDSMRMFIFETHRILSDKGKYVSVEMLYAELIRDEEKKKTFIDFYKEYLKRKNELVGIETTAEIYIKHKRIFEKFKKFIAYKKLEVDLPFEKLNNDLGKDFFNYLKLIDGLSHNTAVKQMQLFKCVIKDAVNRGFITHDPFYEVKLKLKDSPRPYLTQEEIDAIIKLENLFPRVEIVRDIFIFSCYTGLAYIDVQKLTTENIRPGVEGKLWIFTKRQKTDVTSNIPILSQAQVIIDKYSDTVQFRKGKLLPILSNQKMNAYLKEIADLAKINKVLTYHVARHSFATTVTLTNGVPIETVSKMLGHKQIKTTQHYAKIVDLKVSADMKILEEKLGNKLPENKL
jgi:site-specific recombinase XerD